MGKIINAVPNINAKRFCFFLKFFLLNMQTKGKKLIKTNKKFPRSVIQTPMRIPDKKNRIKVGDSSALSIKIRKRQVKNIEREAFNKKTE